jgi:hypothetical protein
MTTTLRGTIPPGTRLGWLLRLARRIEVTSVTNRELQLTIIDPDETSRPLATCTRGLDDAWRTEWHPAPKGETAIVEPRSAEAREIVVATLRLYYALVAGESLAESLNVHLDPAIAALRGER